MIDGLDTIETTLDDIAASLRDCRAEVALGGRIDLAGLDTRVDTLCQDLLAAKPASQRFLPRLNQFVSELDALHAELKTQAGRS